MKSYFFLAFAIVLLLGCEKKPEEHKADSSDSWQLLYRNDDEGNPVFGNKQELLDAARKGYPIRIGFGHRRLNDTTKSVEHVADAHFLTITNSK